MTALPPPARFVVLTRTRLSRAAGVVAIAAAVMLAALPLVAGRELVQDLFALLTLATLAQYWNLLAGYAGLVSVGQQAFVGLGAYALFGLVLKTGMDPLAALPLAGLATAIVALPVARLLFRLAGAYFAIGSWVIAEVFRLLLAQVHALGGGTGTALPRAATTESQAVRWVSSLLHLRANAARDIAAYWLALVVAAGTLAVIYAVLRSRQGLALAAIRDDQRAAGSVGVDGGRAKTAVFVLSALGTGITGALIALQKGQISPDAAFSLLDWTADVIFIVVIGGIGTIEGPIVGTLVFFGLQHWLARYGAWYLMLLGALAVGVMLAAPRGLWGTLAHRRGWALFPVRRRLVAVEGQGTPSPPESIP